MCVFARATNESRCLIGSRCDAQALTYGVLWVREPAERRLFGHNGAPSTEWWCALRTATPFNWGSEMGRGEKGDSTDRGGICNINNFYEAFFWLVCICCVWWCVVLLHKHQHTHALARTRSLIRIHLCNVFTLFAHPQLTVHICAQVPTIRYTHKMCARFYV